MCLYIISPEKYFTLGREKISLYYILAIDFDVICNQNITSQR